MSKTVRKAIGVDFGGTFVKMALVNEKGKILARERIATKQARGQADWLRVVEEGLGQLLHEAKLSKRNVSGIGVGVPGLVDYERGYVHNLTNVPGWSGVHLSKKLKQHFKLRAFVDNDVNAMALGEVLYGAGAKYENAVFVTLGTGVGGGVVINGKLHRGAHSMAGEIGHMTIIKDGIRSSMGRGGLEQYVGNRQIVARAVSALKSGKRSKIRQLVGGRLEDVTPKIIAAAAAQGDRLALEVFDYVADCLATAFASITYLIQPEVFIVGGGVALSGNVLFDPLRRHLKDRLVPVVADLIEVKHATLGNDAGVIGAASLVWSG